YSSEGNIIKWMKESLDFVIQCMDLKTNLKHKANKLLPFNFEEKIKKLDQIASRSFISLQSECKINFEQRNARNLQRVLDAMRTMDDSLFLQKLKSFMEKKASCGIAEEPNIPSNLWTYSEAKGIFNSCFEIMAQEIIKEGIINETTTKPNDVKRDQFFQNLKKKLDFMRQISQWKTHVENVDKFEQCSKQLESEINDIIKAVERIADWTPPDCTRINYCYKCFLSMQKQSILPAIAKSQIETIKLTVKRRITQLEKSVLDNLVPKNLIPCLVAMKTMS
ncbi:hypothetical protein RFI_16536, partial [Reticulomyxa filosa]